MVLAVCIQWRILALRVLALRGVVGLTVCRRRRVLALLGRVLVLLGRILALLGRILSRWRSPGLLRMLLRWHRLRRRILLVLSRRPLLRWIALQRRGLLRVSPLGLRRIRLSIRRLLLLRWRRCAVRIIG
jgi:hypothetical protein